MSSPSSSLQLFGLDLRALWQEFRASWRAVAQSRYLAWLTPAVPVRVLRADGSQLWWHGDPQSSRKAQTGRKAEFEAIEVSESLVLRKRLRMPDMPHAEIVQAAELEARAASPFDPNDLAWGCHAADAAEGGRPVEIVVASRAQVARYVDGQRPRLTLAPGAQPEVWVYPGDGSDEPIILSGWGEQRRQRVGVRHRRMAYALIAAALVIAVALAITPSLQLRSRSLEAIAAFDGIQHETTATVAQRDVFTRSVDRLQVLRGMLAERIDMLQLMTALTNALPDDTYLQSAQTQGLKVTLRGLTADAAVLMQTLSAVPGFKEVRAPVPATRAPGANADNFQIEVQLDPAVFSVATNATAPVPSAPGTHPSATPASSSASASTPAPAPASTPVPAPASTPAAPVPAPAAPPPVTPTPVTPTPERAAPAAPASGPAKPAPAGSAPPPGKRRFSMGGG